MLALALVIASPVATRASTWAIQANGKGVVSTIQAAIDSAKAGDVIVLGPGIYSGPGNRDIKFGGKAITLMSTFGPFQTIIDGQGTTPGLVLENGEGPSTVVTGITFRNAYSDQEGGAIRCDNTSPTIRNCVFENNRAAKNGGAIYVNSGSPTIESCTFVNNSAGTAGGAIYVTGSGAAPQITYTIVAYSTGGEGITCDNGASPLVSCSNFFGNAGGDKICGVDLGSNLYTDPQFCGRPGNGFYYLQADSPCAPKRSPCGALIGSLPVACATVSTEESTWGAIKILFE